VSVPPGERNAGFSRRVILGTLGVLILAIGIACLAGLTSWIILVLAPVPWLLVLRSRLGGILAAAAVILVSFWLLLAVTMLTHVTHLPMLATVVSLWTIGGLIAVALCWRDPRILRKPSVSAASLWLPSFLGGLIWLGVTVASNFVSGAARLSWVMLGDSANNILFARGILDVGGVATSVTDNPVPLPSVVMAIVMASGRGGVAPADLLRHDITAFGVVWALMIALTCFTVGALAGVIARSANARPLVVGIVAGGASLLPLSWFFTGYPIEFGFFNTHVSLPIIFTALLAYLVAERRPAIALGLLCVTATLTLAVWSPLVLMPAALGLVVIIRRWQALRVTRGAALWMLIVCAAQLLTYGLGVVLPGLLHQGYFLTSAGAAFGFHKWMIVGLALAALVLAVVAFRRVRNPVLLGAVAILVASAVGLGALLFVSRDQPSPWSYYPLKFAWLASTIIVVLIVGLAAAVAVKYARPILVQLLCLAVIAAGTVTFLAWTPTAGHGYSAANPLHRVLGGDVLGQGDVVADKIFALSDPKQSSVLWHTGDKWEGSINFWVLQMWAGPTLKNLDLKYAAYGLYGDKSIKVLCKVVGWMGGGTDVYTSQAGLQEKLDNTCPAQHAHVVPESTR
jgi:hypothetical protein